MSKTHLSPAPGFSVPENPRPQNAEIRFELKPKNFGLSDEQLIADLRRVALQLGVKSVKMDTYDGLGVVSSETIRVRFGSWNTAQEIAGLKPIKRSHIVPEEVLADLQRVAGLLETKMLARKTYRLHGRFGPTTVAKVFGSWNSAMEAAGLVAMRTNSKVTAEELLDNLEKLWLHLGRQPCGADLYKPLSRFNLKLYRSRFGGLRNALEAFVAFKKENQNTTARPRKIKLPAHVRIHKTKRTVNIRLRYKILCRDHFRCRACGRSPANDPSVILHVDHVVPWSLGGETVEKNLQTLCDICNGGKSNSGG